LKIKPTVLAVLNESKNRLQNAGIDNPGLAAEILVAARLNCPRLELYRRTNENLTSAQIAAIKAGTRRLEKHEPIQYVLGQTDFMGRVFKCDSRALIPRPETEELVECVIGHEPLRQIDRPAIIDIGTGSGCIIVSLALRMKNGNFWAVDVSAGAIELAAENARANNVADKIRFLTADFALLRQSSVLGFPLRSDSFRLRQGYAGQVGGQFAGFRPSFTGREIPSGMDAVVANPPYVRAADFAGLEKNVRLWEPRLALDGGADGLQVIRPLVQKAYEILKPDRFLFLEIGFDQWPAVQHLLAETGFSRGCVRPDCSGHNRLVMAVK